MNTKAIKIKPIKLKLKEILVLNAELSNLLKEKLSLFKKYEINRLLEEVSIHLSNLKSIEKETFKDFTQYKLIKDIPENKMDEYFQKRTEYDNLLEKEEEIKNVFNLDEIMKIESTSYPYSIIFKLN